MIDNSKNCLFTKKAFRKFHNLERQIKKCLFDLWWKKIDFHVGVTLPWWPKLRWPPLLGRLRFAHGCCCSSALSCFLTAAAVAVSNRISKLSTFLELVNSHQLSWSSEWKGKRLLQYYGQIPKWWRKIWNLTVAKISEFRYKNLNCGTNFINWPMKWLWRKMAGECFRWSKWLWQDWILPPFTRSIWSFVRSNTIVTNISMVNGWQVNKTSNLSNWRLSC